MSLPGCNGENDVLTLPSLALVTAPVTPPRPFMRNTVAEYKHSWTATLGTLIMTRSSFAEAFDALGFAMIPDFRNTIIKGVPPPSAPSTIAFKKRIGKEYANTPLILTRTMLASIAYEVIE